MMPNFLIVGAMKSGTGSLYSFLAQHHQVFMCPRREPNFFAFDGETPSPPFIEGASLPPVSDLGSYQALFASVRDELAVGEKSHSYLYLARAPERIKHYIPHAKLIFILRNPIERAYSHFLFHVRNGREELNDFSQAIEAEPTRVQENYPLGHYIARGFYGEQISRYLDFFDRSQMAFYLFDDLVTDPVRLSQHAFTFLEVDDEFVPDVSIKRNPSGIPRSRHLERLLRKGNQITRGIQRTLPPGLYRWAQMIRDRNLAKPPMSADLRELLRGIYREDIANTESLIERDLSGWLLT